MDLDGARRSAGFVFDWLNTDQSQNVVEQNGAPFDCKAPSTQLYFYGSA